MPFKTLKQELYMRRNNPSLWRKWVKKYGHHPSYSASIKKTAKKAARTRRGRKK